jgi:hypothetical protein
VSEEVGGGPKGAGGRIAVLLMRHDGRENQASGLGVSVNDRVPTNPNGLENQLDLGENPRGGMTLFLVRLLSQILRDHQGSIMTPEEVLPSIAEADAWLPITVVRQAFGHDEVLGPSLLDAVQSRATAKHGDKRYQLPSAASDRILPKNFAWRSSTVSDLRQSRRLVNCEPLKAG